MQISATAIALTGSDQAAHPRAGIYRGIVLANTSSTNTAQVRVYDNASAASGTLLDDITLAASESTREWYGDGGIWAPNGIYIKIVSGTVEGSVRVG